MASSASNSTIPSARPSSMTVAEAQALIQTRPCEACGELAVEIDRNTHNDGHFIACQNCGAMKARVWSDAPAFLKKDKNKKKKRRAEFPDGESLAEVWERYGNICVSCGAPAEFLDRVGIKRERHHAMAYAQHGHQGPILPFCGECHTQTTARQRAFWFWYRIVQGAEK